MMKTDAKRIQALLLVLLLCVAYAEQCFSVEWNYGRNARKTNPVTKLINGNTFAETLDFYRFGKPYGATSNTGYEEDSTITVIVTRDESGRDDMLFLLDAPCDNQGRCTITPSFQREADCTTGCDNDGGDSLFTFNIRTCDTNMNCVEHYELNGIRLIRRDDNGSGRFKTTTYKGESCIGFNGNSCCNAGNDCYYYSNCLGYGVFRHRWWSCCNDGLVMGHLPQERDYCINLGNTFLFMTNDAQKTNKFKFVYEDDNGQAQQLRITLDELGRDFKVCARECDDYCERFDNCGDCTNNDRCGWCHADGGSCVSGEASGPSNTTQCAANDYDFSCCDECAALNTCAECGTVQGCGWCDYTNQCRSGTSLGTECVDGGDCLLYSVNGTCAFPDTNIVLSEAIASDEALNETQVLYDDFAHNSGADWSAIQASDASPSMSWIVSGGMISQTSTTANNLDTIDSRGAFYVNNDLGYWREGTWRFNIKNLDRNYMGAVVRFQDEDNYYEFEWAEAADICCNCDRRTRRIKKRQDGVVSVLFSDKVGYGFDAWYMVELSVNDIEVEGVNGTQLDLFIDGVFVTSVQDFEAGRPEAGLLGFSTAGSKASFDELYFNAPYELMVLGSAVETTAHNHVNDSLGWTVFRLDATAIVSGFSVQAVIESDEAFDSLGFYVRRGAYPTLSQYDYRDNAYGGLFDFTSDVADVYYVGVYSRSHVDIDAYAIINDVATFNVTDVGIVNTSLPFDYIVFTMYSQVYSQITIEVTPNSADAENLFVYVGLGFLPFPERSDFVIEELDGDGVYSIVINTPQPDGVIFLSFELQGGAAPDVDLEIRVVLPEPVIGQLIPSLGETDGSTLLEIRGSDFGGDGVVQVDGVNGTVVTYSGTSITFYAPEGQGKNLPLVLATNGYTSNSISFSYRSPVLTSISPQTGSTAGGFLLNLTGTSFGLSGVVEVGSTPLFCTQDDPDAIYTHTKITCKMPPGGGSVNSVLVKVDDVPSPTTSFNFAYDPPTISSVDPLNGPTGGGTTITIEGANFGPTATVTIGNEPCTSVTSNTSYITCDVPEGEGTDNGIAVTYVSQTSPTTFFFAYDRPVLISVDPSTDNTTGGETFTLDGSNFGLTPAVTFGEILAETLLTVSADSITGIVPEGVGTDLVVRVEVAGQVSEENVLFTYAAPTITTLSLDNDSTLGASQIIIDGYNFGPVGNVFFGTRQCDPALVYGDTQISCFVPPGDGADLNLTVSRGPGESVSAPVSFSYRAPVISSVSNLAANYPTSGSVTMSITGSNFGPDSASITFDGTPCAEAISFHTHSFMRCTLPAGQGTVDVVVTVNGQESDPFSFSYNRPTVTSVSPQGATTDGSVQVLVIGTNFGQSGAVSIGGLDCPTNGSYSFSAITCDLPENVGADLPVLVTVGGQTDASSITYTYGVPHIEGISMLNGRTGYASPQNVTISGRNFGQDGDTQVTFGGVTLASSVVYHISHEEIVFELPSGTGVGYEIALVTGDQDSECDIASCVFDYDPPSISAVSGCTDDGSTTVDCTILGDTGGVTLTGTSFGDENTTVTIKGEDCDNVAVTVGASEDTLVCDLPAIPEGGFGVDVVITVDGQSDTAAGALSYTGPEIVAGSLRLCSSGSGTDNLTDLDPAGGERICFQIDNMEGAIASEVEIFYGGSAFSQFPDGYWFNCTNIAASDPNVECDLAPGMGTDLQFYVNVGLQTSPIGPNVLSYTPPEFVKDSIRSAVGAAGDEKVTIASSLGAFVFFNMTNIPYTSHDHLWELLAFKIGDESDAYDDLRYTCSSVSVIDDVTVKCFTGKGDDVDLKFQLTALNTLTDKSNFTFNFPIPPTITAASGCTDDGVTTIDCPTVGGNRLTFTGSDFCDFTNTNCTAIVEIGFALCENPVYNGINEFECTLPASTGLNEPVTITTVNEGEIQFSAPANLISYATASITAVKGCTDQGATTVDCPRNETTEITLTGADFGASGASVLIDGEECTGLVHDETEPDKEIRCSIPFGKELNRDVILIQRSGDLSANSGLLSYYQCPAGTHVDANSFDCIPCSPGFYSSIEGLADCIACPSGFFAAGTGSTICTRCGTGEFSLLDSGAGTSQCTPCSTGSASAATGASSCTDCDVGFYADEQGLTSCTKCARGNFTDETGSEECEHCLPGSFAAATGTVTCSPCDVGSVTDEDGAEACTPCLEGRHAPSQGLEECANCTVGKAAPNQGQANCDLCDGGFFSNATGLDACFECSAGSYSTTNTDSGVSSCTPCLAGEYMDLNGQPTCLRCPSGTFANGTGNTECTPCPSGERQPATGQSSCIPCSPGDFVDGVGNTQCKKCPAGRFEDGPGSGECQLCPVGKRQAAIGQQSCTNCTIGRAVATEGQAQCEPCAAGRVATNTGLATCEACAAGSVAVFGALECSACAEGRFTDVAGQSQCVACPAGTFANGTGNAECSECPTGRFAAETGLTVCDVCDPGTFASLTGSFFCESCEPGTAANSSETETCAACDPGFAQSESGAEDCVGCSPGFFTSIPSQPTCLRCPAGKYSNTSETSSCTACEAGRASSATAQTECTLCEPGKFTATTGLLSCNTCPSGRYSPSEGASECLPCAAGNFSLAGASTCTSCDAGSFTSAEAQGQCRQCVPGTFTATAGLASCEVCLPGTFTEDSGSEFCRSCGLGKAAGDIASTQCEPCPVGTLGNETGMAQCYECTEGYYQNLEGQSDCFPCEPGTFTAVLSSAVCQQCAPGEYQNASAATDCIPCEAGRAIDIAGAADCANCPLGRSTAVTGRLTCTLCTRGRFANETGLEQCIDCPAGSFGDNSGLSECTLCAPGSDNPSPAQVKCNLCFPGFYAAQNGTLNCDACEAGKYVGVSGASECLSCPIGRTNPSTGQDECALCAPGTVANTTGTQSCTDCPRGTFQLAEGQAECSVCPAGFEARSVKSTSCTECDTGKFAASPGTAECSNCPAGKFNDKLGQSFCADCPPGTFSTGSATDCSPCTGDEVAPIAGLSECVPCDSRSYANDDATNCICDPGLFSRINGSIVNCFGCPDGALCNVEGVAFTALQTERGYWRSSTDSLSFYRCLLNSHCTGGRGSTCGNFRTGPICALCQEGYKEFGVQCEPCPESKQQSVWLSVLLFILLIGVICFMYFVVLRVDKQLMRKVKKQQEWEAQFEDADYYDDDETLETYTIHGPPAPKPNLVYKMKILLGFFQILVGIMFAVEIDWPDSYKSFVAVFNLANFDVVSLTRVGCVVSVNYYRRHLAIVSLPIILCSSLFVVYVTPKYLRYFYHRKDELSVRREYEMKLKRGFRKFGKLFMFTLFLVYPSVSSTVVRLYNCRNIDGVSYLAQDFSLECYTDEWNQRALLNILFVLLYPFGIPFFFTMLLLRNKHQLHKPEVKISIGFLFGAFSRQYWWFEIVDMLHKLTLTSILPFLFRDSQLPFAMSVICGHAIILLLFRPYLRKGDDQLHLSVQTELFLLILAGWVFEFEPELDENLDIIVTILFIGLTCLVIVYFGIQVTSTVKKMMKRRKLKKDLKKRRAQIGSSAGPDMTDDEIIMHAEHAHRNMDYDIKITRNTGFVNTDDPVPPPAPPPSDEVEMTAPTQPVPAPSAKPARLNTSRTARDLLDSDED